MGGAENLKFFAPPFLVIRGSFKAAHSPLKYCEIQRSEMGDYARSCIDRMKYATDYVEKFIETLN